MKRDNYLLSRNNSLIVRMRNDSTFQAAYAFIRRMLYSDDQDGALAELLESMPAETHEALRKEHADFSALFGGK